MKYFLILLSINCIFTEILYSQKVYYPLAIGNKWEYEAPKPQDYWGAKGQLSKIISDTVINGKTYAVIAHSDTILGETRYERSDSDKVFRFNPETEEEEIWFDFALNPGDTVNTFYKNNDTLTLTFIKKYEQVVLDKVRNLWKFGLYSSMQFYLSEIDIADSIGIIKYPSDDPELIFDSIYVRGAVIDSVLHRAEYPSIYLPLQPGNWWRLEGGLEITVIKDTIMANDKEYAMCTGIIPDFLRQENNYVYRYEDGIEEIEIDFSAPEEQVYDFQLHSDEEFPYIVRWLSFGFSEDSIFSQLRKVYGYAVDPFPIVDASTGYAYADSIGIIKYTDGMGVDWNIIEAYVNGKHYIKTSVEAGKEVPYIFELAQNYPNPFNPTTTITYSVPISGIVSLRIYDILGRETESLVNNFMSAGEHTAAFNASNLPSGIYFYELEAGNYRAVRKMMLIK